MEMIGQYEIRELLGEGGIGQVHVGFDTVLEREVAIKSLRPELLTDKNFVDRFRAEATSLARLNHPNVTTVYSLLPEGRNLYMIMELVRGDTLDTLLKKRNGPLGVKESLAIIAQAADGLSYAHSMGVIHRDIKPANLMITSAGLLKIMDFGIARVRGSQRLTRDGSMVGTLAYMAPEQLRGEAGDERSDLYSLAIVLYELLTGATPFVADSDYDLMQAHVHAKPQRLVGRVPGLDARVDSVLLRGLAKKPEQRYASVREFSDALGATALRMDAPSMVLEGTRLMERPAVAQFAGNSGSFDRVSRFVDRLVPLLSWAPAGLRVPLVVGVSTFLVAGVLVMGALALMPSPVAEISAKKTLAAAGAQNAARAPEPSAERVSVPPAPKAGPAPASPLQPSAPIVVAPTAAPVDSASRGIAPSAPVEKPSPPSEAQPKADFQAALARKSYAEAFELARPAAERGDREAQFILGWLSYNGRGVDRSEETAASWFQKAAGQNHVLAQLNLAAMYEAGIGVPRSDEQAFNWYRKAADLGNAEAQNDLGIAYARGQGTQRDDFQAVIWYEKAAKQNFPKALKNLGDMWQAGRGVGQRDVQEALKYYYRAAEQNWAPAEFNIGYWYENGFEGQRPEYQKAAYWYARAAEHGHPQARPALDRLRGRGGQGRGQ
jgi:TPR repeat protein/tRNA A-37 threonylcarbamoyl transferase component Bud32